METKKCTKCGVEKEATLENFEKNRKNRGYKSVFVSRCKICINLKRRSNYKENKTLRDKIKIAANNWKRDNRVKHNKKSLDYYRKNKPEVKKKQKRYYTETVHKLLPDSCIKRRIKKQSGVKFEDITPEMIETKRLLIFIKRELKNKDNGN